MHTLILPHEASLLQAGATLLLRPVERCCQDQDVTFDDDLPLNCCGNCGAEWFSPFPPVGTECEAWVQQAVPSAWGTTTIEAVGKLLRFRIAGLEVRRVKELTGAESLFAKIPWERTENNCWKSRLPQWWTTTFPDHDFDSAWAWVATLEPQ